MDATTLCGSSQRRHVALARRSEGYTGLLVAGLIWPLMISALIVFSSDRSDVGTWLARSWKGESATPPLARSPTSVPPLKVPSAALSTAFFTAAGMPWVTLLMKYLQYCGALKHPSVFAHSIVTFVLPAAASASWTALAAPRPASPATGKITSAPSLISVWVAAWPRLWSVKLPVNRPVRVCSFQPRTLTLVWCCWL